MFSRRFEKELVALRKEFEEQQVQLLRYEAVAAAAGAKMGGGRTGNDTGISGPGGGIGTADASKAEDLSSNKADQD